MPPDEIVGFVTRGRGVSVHRADCLNATTLQEGQPDRLIEYYKSGKLCDIELRVAGASSLLGGGSSPSARTFWQLPASPVRHALHSGSNALHSGSSGDLQWGSGQCVLPLFRPL